MTLARDVSEYLELGGEIQHVEKGFCCYDWNPNNHFTTKPNQKDMPARTPVNNVMLEIDARRVQKKIRPNAKNGQASSSRTKKIIYDDFGQPIRQVWD